MYGILQKGKTKKRIINQKNKHLMCEFMLNNTKLFAKFR